MTRTLSMLAGSRRVAVTGVTAVLLLIVLTGGVAQAAGSLSNTTAPSISGIAQSGQTLTADPGSWSGDTSGGYGYQWQRCDTLGASCSPIAGATSSTYTAQEFGVTLVVEVTALDGPTVATSAATAVVRSPDPSGGTCSLVPNYGAADTTVFTVTCQGWSDYNQRDPLTYSVQWWGCDSSGDNCILENQSVPTTVPRVEGILSGFADTFGQGVDRVTMIICEFDGSCTSWSQLAYVSGDLLPYNNPAAPPTVNGHLWLGETLSVDLGAWSNDPTSYSYQWRSCGSVFPGYISGQRHDPDGYTDCAPIDGATGATYTVQPSDLGHAFMVGVTAYNAQGQTTVYGPTTTRLAGPPSAALAGLTVNTGTLSPAFDAATGSYSLTVPYSTSTIALTPTLDDANATVKINGIAATSGTAVSKPLSVGANTFTTVVTAADGTTTHTYTVTVTRAAAARIATLAGLTVGQGTLSPAFTANTPIYTVSVPNSVSSFTYTPTAAEAHATLTVKNGISSFVQAVSGQAVTAPLPVGVTSFAVKVIAEDGTTFDIYQVRVTRAISLSSDATLSALALGNGTLSPAFTSATTDYSATVPYTTGSLDLTPTTGGAAATVTVNGAAITSGHAQSETLGVGVNTFTVTATAEDGTNIRTYTVTVTRAAASQNTALSNLAFSEGALGPAFQSGGDSYTVAVPNDVISATLTPTVADANASVTVNGSPVMSGSATGTLGLLVGATTLTVTVTAQDRTTRTYTVTVTRAAPLVVTAPTPTDIGTTNDPSPEPVSNPSAPLSPVFPVTTPMPTLTVVLATQTGTTPRSTEPGSLPPVTAPQFSTKATVKLETAAPAGTTQVVVSNNVDFSNATTFPVNRDGVYQWTLAETGAANGDRIVYVRFVIPGSLTMTLTANVKLDDKAPVVSKPHYVAKNKGSIKVSVPATDRASGVRFTQFAPTVKHPWRWTRYTAKPSVRTKQTFIYVRTADAAGNISAWQKIAFPAKTAKK
jgi:hypothetical protein